MQCNWYSSWMERDEKATGTGVVVAASQNTLLHISLNCAHYATQ